MPRPQTVAVPGYIRGAIPTDPQSLPGAIVREFDKVQRAQPNTNTTSITADYALLITDRTVLVDTTAGDVTIQLFGADRRLVLPVTIIKISADGHSVHVVAAGTDHIGTGTTLTWSLAELAYTIYPDGDAHWWIESTARQSAGPSLTVSVTPGPTDFAIAYSASGAVGLSIDGGAFVAPGASPLLVARDSNNHTLAFKCTDSGQDISETVHVPALPPSLALDVTPGGTSYALGYTAVGSLELSIDGGAFAAAGASPIVVTRDAVDHVYTFRCVSGDQDIRNAITIPALPAPSSGGGFSALSNVIHDYATDTVDFAWAWAGDPTATFNVRSREGAGGPYSLEPGMPLAAGSASFTHQSTADLVDGSGPVDGTVDIGFYVEAVVGGSVVGRSDILTVAYDYVNG